jgi:hypothetical protein
MAVLTLPQSGQEQTILEIDYIGQKYGLFRQEDESIDNFKKRILSLFVNESSETESGYSGAIARAFGTYPKPVGYIRITDENYRIRFNGYKLTIYSDIDTEEKYFDVLDSTSIGEVDQYLIDNEIGEFIYLDEKYKTKEIGFLFPFANFENRRETRATLGGINLFDRHIIPDSFRSKSEYFTTQKISSDLVQVKGDYYFDEVNRLLIYDDKSETQFAITYSKIWQYVPVVYCPVMIKGLQSLSLTSETNNYSDKLNVTLADSVIFNEIDHNYLELFLGCYQLLTFEVFYNYQISHYSRVYKSKKAKSSQSQCA